MPRQILTTYLHTMYGQIPIFAIEIKGRRVKKLGRKILAGSKKNGLEILKSVC